MTTIELDTAAGRALRLDWDFDRRQFALRDAATGDDLTSEHGGGTDPAGMVERLHGVSRSAYLRVGSVAQQELAEIGSEAGGVRTAIERAAGQAESNTGLRRGSAAARAPAGSSSASTARRPIHCPVPRLMP